MVTISHFGNTSYMKIAQLAPVWISVPPEGYGGIEWIASLLADGLTDKGHDVTLFACGTSKTKGRLISSYTTPQRFRMGAVYPDLIHALSCYLIEEQFDIIHDHSGLIGPSIGAFSKTPVLHTFHGPFTEDAKHYYRMLNNRIYYNSISLNQASTCPDLNYAANVYNAIDVPRYPFYEDKDDYLVFLGRVAPLKGTHIAINVAKRLGRRLKILGKIEVQEEHDYFEQMVKPHLNHQIEFYGELEMDEKTELVGKAACLLFPIQWPEPFGLVMIEAMATGTPVIAYGAGSVPEIVEPRVNGYIVQDEGEMADAVLKIDRIAPRDCRRTVEERFSVEHMVSNYERVYQNILEEEQGRLRLSA